MYQPLRKVLNEDAWCERIARQAKNAPRLCIPREARLNRTWYDKIAFYKYSSSIILTPPPP